MFSILIVEDDICACKELTDYFSKIDDTCIIGCTATISEAVSLCQLHKPDALILELELHQGSGTGLDFLDKLNNLPDYEMPYVLITTNNSSQIVYERARQLGAGFILYKHQNNYSSEYAASFLLSMKDVIKNTSQHSSSKSNDMDLLINSRQLRNRILNKLQILGFNPKYKGYIYLLDAIEMAYSGTHYFISKVAKKHSATEASVERAMQNAISKAWNSTDVDILQKHYTSKVNPIKGSPTPVEFVRYFSNIDL